MDQTTNPTQKRVAVFLDVANTNLRMADSNIKGVKLDYGKMTRMLAAGREITGMYAFCSAMHVHEQNSFYGYLKGLGYELDIRESCPETRGQKEVDVSMALKIQHHAHKDDYDVAIIVSGDRDFSPAVEAVHSLGKTVEVASFQDRFSNSLKGKADAFIILDELCILNISEATFESTASTGGLYMETMQEEGSNGYGH